MAHSSSKTRLRLAITAVVSLSFSLAMLAETPLVLATTTGAKNGTAFATVDNSGGVSWSNPSNAQSSDNSWASATLTTGNRDSDYLQATGFGFSIPAGATINGITVSVERSASVANVVRDEAVQMIKGGTRVGTAFDGTGNAYNWGTTDATASFGSGTYLWGTTWSVADITASNFGVAFVARHASSGGSASARVDQITLTVTYTLPTTTTTVNCATNPVTYGGSTDCTATVTRSAGTNTPSGTVSFGTSASGTFSSGGTCTLSGAGGTATCSITYTPSAVGGGTHTITGTYAGDVNFQGGSGTKAVTVSRKAITASVTAAGKAYDGTTSATIATCTPNNLVGTDVVTCSAGAAAFTNKNAGTGKAVNATGITLGGTNAANYTLSSTTAATTATISARHITVAATSNSRAYDGTIASSAVPVITSGALLGGDTASWSQTFDSKNVGASRTLTATGSVADGNSGANYAVTFDTATGVISPRVIVVSASTDSRPYDGTIASSAVPTVTSGSLIVGDTGAFTQTFDSKNVGTHKTLTATGSVADGNSGANYAVAFVVDTTGVIGQRSIAVTADNKGKVYGETDPALTYTITSGSLVPGDALTGAIGRLPGEDIGTYDIVQDTLAASTNYDLTFTKGTFTIGTAKVYASVTISDKVYDGGVTATITGRSLSGVLLTDDVTLTGGTATFVDKNVGTGKTVNVSGLSITGAQHDNYVLDSSSIVFSGASITPASLTPTVSIGDKPYDGSLSATITGRSLTGRIDPDDVSLAGGVAAFADKNVANNKPVSITGLTLSGADALNYTAPTTAVGSASITPATLTITAAGVDKVYDGTAAATATYGDNRLTGDLLTVSGTATFADGNVGTGKTVSIVGLGITGTDAGNYVPASTTGSTIASITPRPITVTADAKTKVYGKTDPTFTAAVSSGSLVLGDSITGTPARDAGENAGTYPIRQGTVTAGGNYALTFVNGVFTITQAPTTVTITPANNPARPGTITFTLSVSPWVATGSITIKDGSDVLGTVTMLGLGDQSFDASLSEGTHAITAVFTGNINYAGSTSSVLQQSMQKGAALGSGVGGSRRQGGGIASGSFGGPALNTPTITTTQKSIVCRLQEHASTIPSSVLSRLLSRLAVRWHWTTDQVKTAVADPTLCTK